MKHFTENLIIKQQSYETKKAIHHHLSKNQQNHHLSKENRTNTSNDFDDETVSNDTSRPAENHKVLYSKAYKLLNAQKIVKLPDSTNICNDNPKIYIKFNLLYKQIHG